MANIFQNIKKIFTIIREKVSVPFLHTCHVPPKEVMAVLACQNESDLWQQRRCEVCGVISHWRRDTPYERFTQWIHVGGAPVTIDMSDQDLRKDISPDEPVPENVLNDMLKRFNEGDHD